MTQLSDRQLLQVFRCMARLAGIQAPGDEDRIVGPSGYIVAAEGRLHVFAYRRTRGSISFFHGDVHEQRDEEQVKKVQEFEYTNQPAGCAALINIGLATFDGNDPGGGAPLQVGGVRPWDRVVAREP